MVNWNVATSKLMSSFQDKTMGCKVCKYLAMVAQSDNIMSFFRYEGWRMAQETKGLIVELHVELISCMCMETRVLRGYALRHMQPQLWEKSMVSTTHYFPEHKVS
ncbi:hypothetical protein M758_6G045000 [Ceratodon purpureus]|nr:hypothetical protein M758_6G045000 [Ceratodon purpureus]